MMDIQVIFAIGFMALLAVIIFLNRKKLVLQKILFPLIYIFMYRSKFGISGMDRLAKKFPRLIRGAGYSFIVLGFAGMAFIAYKLAENLYLLYFVKKAVPGVGVLQPFSQNLPGTVYVPFFYFIISLFIVVIVHEFSHGVLARAHNLPVNASGVGIMGLLVPILPLAFVEPDESKLVKRPYKQQLSIFAAGPMSNIILGIIFLLLFFAAAHPLDKYVMQREGVIVHDLVKEGYYPIQDSGIQKGELITEMDSQKVISVSNFSSILSKKQPGDIIHVVTNKTAYDIKLGFNPDDASKPYMGVFVADKTGIKESFKAKYGNFLPSAFMWVMGLLFWLYALNIGIGFFNLVPITICDGGRMLQLALRKGLGKKREAAADKIWKNIGILFILMLVMIIVKGCSS